MWRHLEAALNACRHPPLTWYEATKHTFASHYLMNGGRIERLATILGHTDAEVTRRYGHLWADLFPEEEFNAVGLARPTHGPGGTVAGTNGLGMAHKPQDGAAADDDNTDKVQ